MYSFRVANNTISKVVSEMYEVIIAKYAEEVIKTLTEEEKWREAVNQYSTKWHFHHALGALDGKHAAIRCPGCGGFNYFKYKGYHAIVASAGLTLILSSYGWTLVLLAYPQIWNQSDFKEHVIDEAIHIQPADPLSGDDRDTPYFIIAYGVIPHDERVVANALEILATISSNDHRMSYQVSRWS